MLWNDAYSRIIQYNTTQEFDFPPNQLSRQLDTWKNVSGFPLRKFSRLFHKWSLITAPVKLWEPIKAPELKWNNCLTTNTFKMYNSEFRITLDFCLCNSTLSDIWVDFFFVFSSIPNSSWCLLLAVESCRWEGTKTSVENELSANPSWFTLTSDTI